MIENTMAIEVNPGVIDRVRSGEVTHIALQLDEDNKNDILKNVIKNSLQFLVLSEGDKSCLVQILGVDTEPTVRFNHQGAGMPIIPVSNGDSCIWEVRFEVLPVLEKPKKYLMRWNPSISSFTEQDYEECVENMENETFRMNWSIYEWEEARRGDFFYMMRVGDDKAGIVFNGQFLSDPYPSDDWAGSTKRRMYVDMVCRNPVAPGETPSVSLDKLKEAIPSIDWSKGHSGALLPTDVEEKLLELWSEE